MRRQSTSSFRRSFPVIAQLGTVALSRPTSPKRPTNVPEQAAIPCVYRTFWHCLAGNYWPPRARYDSDLTLYLRRAIAFAPGFDRTTSWTIRADSTRRILLECIEPSKSIGRASRRSCLGRCHLSASNCCKQQARTYCLVCSCSIPGEISHGQQGMVAVERATSNICPRRH